MDRWQSMRIFAKVAETANFALTARQIHMSPPAVTRAVAALEDAIGARLFVRTTWSVKLTEVGTQLQEAGTDISASFDDLQSPELDEAAADVEACSGII